MESKTINKIYKKIENAQLPEPGDPNLKTEIEKDQAQLIQDIWELCIEYIENE